MGPRWAKKKLPRNDPSRLDNSWRPLGPTLRPSLAMLNATWPFKAFKICLCDAVFVCALCFFVCVPVNLAQHGCEDFQDGPKMAPRTPKMLPRWPQDRPRDPRRAPKAFNLDLPPSKCLPTPARCSHKAVHSTEQKQMHLCWLSYYTTHCGGLCAQHTRIRDMTLNFEPSF